MKKLMLDIASIIAVSALAGSIIGWVISVERRMAERVTTETFYADQKLAKETLIGEIRVVKTELDTDVRGLRERMNDIVMTIYQGKVMPIDRLDP